jgi:hypothetical protein
VDLSTAMGFERKRSQLGQEINAVLQRVEAGMRRPARMIFETLAEIGRLKFRSPEQEAMVAAELRASLLQLDRSLFTEEQVEVLASGLDTLKRQLIAIAKSSAPSA